MHFYLERAQQAIDLAIKGMSHAPIGDGQITADHLGQSSVGTQPGKWTGAQILEHLSLAYGSTGRLLERCLQSGKPSATAPTFSKRIAAGFVLALGRLPSGREAPSFTRPRGLPPDAALTAFHQNLQAMDETIARCETRFGAHLKIADHPFLGPLTLPQWRKFHWIHTRHHARQLRRLRKEASTQS